MPLQYAPVRTATESKITPPPPTATAITAIAHPGGPGILTKVVLDLNCVLQGSYFKKIIMSPICLSYQSRNRQFAPDYHDKHQYNHSNVLGQLSHC